MWVVYGHAKRKHQYAKRVYFPSNAFDICIEGSGLFKNRSGNDVYGIKIIYKMTIELSAICIRDKEIHLPKRTA